MQVLFEIMVNIKQKRGIRVENPSPRSFSGGIYHNFGVQLTSTQEIPVQFVYMYTFWWFRCMYLFFRARQCHRVLRNPPYWLPQNIVYIFSRNIFAVFWLCYMYLFFRAHRCHRVQRNQPRWPPLPYLTVYGLPSCNGRTTFLAQSPAHSIWSTPRWIHSVCMCHVYPWVMSHVWISHVTHTMLICLVTVAPSF